MPPVYLALGSNLGDRAANLRAAAQAIAQLPTTSLTAESPVYETPPMGPQDQGAYLNMAAAIQTDLTPAELMKHLHTIEREIGRVAPEDRRHWGPREIDIDVLLFGDRVINTPTLTIPHAGMAERWFVLKPLADLAPDLRHPILKQTIAELLDQVDAPARYAEARL